MEFLFLKSRRLGADSSPPVSGHSPHPTMADNMAYTSGPLSAFNTKVIIVTACLLLVLILALLVNVSSRWFLRRLLLPGSTAAAAGEAAAAAAAGAAMADLKRKAPPGLKKDQLLSLPTTTYLSYNSTKHGHQSPSSPPTAGELALQLELAAAAAALTQQCPICLLDFRGGERIRVLPKCQHGFHVTCIDQWLINSSSCPTCRGDLMDNLP